MAADTVPLNGYAVRALRQARRMKQQTLAVGAEISASYLSEIESSVKVNVSREILGRIMDALMLAPEEERALTRWWLTADAVQVAA